jgi:hypothetical protein
VSWIVVAAWAGAVVLAGVVLGFCAYEISWKSARLRSDLARLQATQGEAMTLRTQLTDVAERLARARAH